MSGPLFVHVTCNGYLKKISDGRYIDVYRGPHGNGAIQECTYVFGYDSEKCQEIKQDVETYDGSRELLKTYYERKEKRFAGFVVGYKDIIETGWLVCDTADTWQGGEEIILRKEPEKITRCAIVYFSDNKKRYVPVEDVNYE